MLIMGIITMLVLINCEPLPEEVVCLQARRVDSVEGGSVMFWEVLFSARGANTCAEGASL